MTLNVENTRRQKKPAMILAGGSGIGKTHLCASINKAVAILTEDGAHHVDMQAFPLAKSFDDVLNYVGDLYREDHDFEWLVIDSLDWLEPLMQTQAAAENGWRSVDEAPYGRGYTETLKLWRRLTRGLDALRDEKGMGVICTCHTAIKRIETPTQDAFDAFTMKLHHKAAAQLTEWADVIGYACHRIATKNEDSGFGKARKRAISTGERLLLVEPNPAYPSKNRYGLTDGPLDWASFSNALSEAQTTENQK